MGEPRRVQAFPSLPLGQPRLLNTSQKVDSKMPTLRFELELFPSSNDKCPEFNYVQLVRSSMKKEGQENLVGPDNHYGEEHEDEALISLAKRFEEKYGPSSAAKKPRKKHFDDFVDIGYGYDESDSFLDNSEAYDEVVPSDWTTEYGGFYINQGDLDFRPLTQSREGQGTTIPPNQKCNKNKKAESNKDKGVAKPSHVLGSQKHKKHQLLNKERKLKNHILLKAKKQSIKKPVVLANDDSQDGDIPLAHIGNKSFEDDVPLAKIAKIVDSKEDDIPLAKIAEKSADAVPLAKLSNSCASSELLSRQAPEVLNGTALSGTCSAESSKVKSIPAHDLQRMSGTPTPTPAQCLNGASQTPPTIIPVKSSPVSDSSRDAHMDRADLTDPEISKVVKVEAPLPPGVGEELMKDIRDLKEAALAHGSNKGKFFSPDTNQILLRFARNVRKLSPRLRSTVNDHVLFYLPCAKDTLVKKCRALVVKHQVDLIDEPILKLSNAIASAMPAQQKVYDDKLAVALKEQVREQMKSTGFDLAAKEIKTEPLGFEEEAAKKHNFPKRKFLWTDELRSLLCDVVKVRVGLYKMSKHRSLSPEDYIKDFLEAEIRKLWPKGWMTSRILYTESKQGHCEITSVKERGRKAKPVVLPGPSATPSDRRNSSANDPMSSATPLSPLQELFGTASSAAVLVCPSGTSLAPEVTSASIDVASSGPHQVLSSVGVVSTTTLSMTSSYSSKRPDSVARIKTSVAGCKTDGEAEPLTRSSSVVGATPCITGSRSSVSEDKGCPHSNNSMASGSSAVDAHVKPLPSNLKYVTHVHSISHQAARLLSQAAKSSVLASARDEAQPKVSSASLNGVLPTLVKRKSSPVAASQTGGARLTPEQLLDNLNNIKGVTKSQDTAQRSSAVQLKYGSLSGVPSFSSSPSAAVSISACSSLVTVSCATSLPSAYRIVSDHAGLRSDGSHKFITHIPSKRSSSERHDYNPKAQHVVVGAALDSAISSKSWYEQKNDFVSALSKEAVIRRSLPHADGLAAGSRVLPAEKTQAQRDSTALDRVGWSLEPASHAAPSNSSLPSFSSQVRHSPEELARRASIHRSQKDVFLEPSTIKQPFSSGFSARGSQQSPLNSPAKAFSSPSQISSQAQGTSHAPPSPIRLSPVSKSAAQAKTPPFHLSHTQCVEHYPTLVQSGGHSLRGCMAQKDVPPVHRSSLDTTHNRLLSDSRLLHRQLHDFQPHMQRLSPTDNSDLAVTRIHSHPCTKDIVQSSFGLNYPHQSFPSTSASMLGVEFTGAVAPVRSFRQASSFEDDSDVIKQKPLPP